MSSRQNQTSAKGTSGGGQHDSYSVTGRGTNSQGNRYDNRAESAGSGYHYSNNDGSYYYKHGDGSTYHNTGPAQGGHSTYTAPNGYQYKKSFAHLIMYQQQQQQTNTGDAGVQLTGQGTNAQGNDWLSYQDSRGQGYAYNNKSGSTYQKNTDGSSLNVSPQGKVDYTPAPEMN